jgi:hypothetical protein
MELMTPLRKNSLIRNDGGGQEPHRVAALVKNEREMLLVSGGTLPMYRRNVPFVIADCDTEGGRMFLRNVCEVLPNYVV